MNTCYVALLCTAFGVLGVLLGFAIAAMAFKEVMRDASAQVKAHTQRLGNMRRRIEGLYTGPRDDGSIRIRMGDDES